MSKFRLFSRLFRINGGCCNRAILQRGQHWVPIMTSKRTVKIYTKTGDKGTSATFTGERRRKDDIIFEALGTTDELTSAIGLATEFCNDAGHPFIDRLEQIQCVLQDVSSNIATPKSSARDSHSSKTAFSSQHVTDLESWIDEYSAELPPLKNFILPSGGKSAASLHVARAICRRAERRHLFAELTNKQNLTTDMYDIKQVTTSVRAREMDEEPMKYLNRLSDLLFTMARLAAHREGQEEKIYRRVYPPPEN